MIEKDKIIHASVCATASAAVMLLFRLIGSAICESIISAALVAMGMGVTKEFADSLNPNNKWDWFDLLADLIGAIIGILFSLPLWLR